MCVVYFFRGNGTEPVWFIYLRASPDPFFLIGLSDIGSVAVLCNNSVDKLQAEGHSASVWAFVRPAQGLFLQRYEWVSTKRTNWRRAKVGAQI